MSLGDREVGRQVKQDLAVEDQDKEAQLQQKTSSDQPPKGNNTVSLIRPEPLSKSEHATLAGEEPGQEETKSHSRSCPSPDSSQSNLPEPGVAKQKQEIELDEVDGLLLKYTWLTREELLRFRKNLAREVQRCGFRVQGSWARIKDCAESGRRTGPL
jgi:hypothetical protein